MVCTSERPASTFERLRIAKHSFDGRSCSRRRQSRPGVTRAPRRSSASLLVGAVPPPAGCAVGPHVHHAPGDRSPDKWRAAGDARVTTQTAADSLWWKSFNDPALDRLVELAYRQNLPLQIAGLRIVEARAQFGVATGRQFPQMQALFGSGGGGRAHRAGRAATPGSTATSLELPARLRRRLGAGLLGQVPARRRGGGGRPARVGGRLRHGAGVADRGGGAHATSRSAPSRC